MRRIIASVLCASVLSMPATALAHSDHYDHTHSEPRPSLLRSLVGLAVVGGAVYLGTRDYPHYYYGGRRTGRVVGSYYRDGKRYRVCRNGYRRFYC